MKAAGAATAAATIGAGAETAVAQDLPIPALVNRMSVREKAAQMIQPVIGSLDPTTESSHDNVETVGDIVGEIGAGSVLSGGAMPPTTDPEALVAGINELQEYAIENSPHGIPFFYGIDGTHGAAYVDGATALPQRHNMGATRDPDLIERAEEHTAAMIAATGIHETYAPTIELQRDPRWGRYFEGISESTKVLGDISRARNRALEGHDRVTATPKHFAGYEIPTNGNDRSAVNTSMRDLRETLLPPFEVTLAEGAGMVMVNSGSVNGVPAHVSQWLLTDLLRGEYGFEGVILTDWNDLYRLIGIHDLFPDTRAGKKMAVRAAIAAGVDMAMLGGGNEGRPLDPREFVTYVDELVESGDLTEQRIDASVRRILELKQDLGLFDDPYADESLVTDLVGNDESVATSTEIARESLVLLKNEPVTEGGDPVLPLAGDEDLLVTGPGVDPETGIENRILMQYGGWTLGWQGIEAGSLSEGGPRPAGDSMIAALRDHHDGAITHVPTDFDRTEWWQGEWHPEEGAPNHSSENGDYGFTDDQRSAVESAAPEADAVVVVIGEGPHNEGFGDRDSLELPETQREIIATVEAATDDETPIVAVEYAGSPRGNQESFGPLDAVLYAGQPATGGGTAIAETLLGAYNPSGRLGFSWPQQVGHGPLHHNAWPGNGHDPTYPYGHGLSYTTFEYANLSVSPATVDDPARETVTLGVDVTNTGDMAGEHVVEVYNTTAYGTVMHRDTRVVGYERVSLDPGETTRAEVEIDLAALEVVAGDVPGLGPKHVEATDYVLTVDPESDLSTTLTVTEPGSVLEGITPPDGSDTGPGQGRGPPRGRGNGRARGRRSSLIDRLAGRDP
ncbi:beta-glucosidase [Halococcoides cellulosivorans]|uniref:beta-glucosidase n=1 Tax=Halococcoides cellulosivorans TaxID=1679096 RepID=A0A2R4X4C0_9EURY|nr:beta-glucosidase [Halococcoides cellulosivorans]